MTVPPEISFFRGSETLSAFPETNVYAKKHPRFLCIINYNKSISLIEGICQLSYYNKMTANKDKLLSKTQIIIVVRLVFGNRLMLCIESGIINVRSRRAYCTHNLLHYNNSSFYEFTVIYGAIDSTVFFPMPDTSASSEISENGPF